MANQPIEEIRIGAIRAAIWENEGQNGARYTVSLSRLYKEGSEWKSSQSFSRDDLLTAAKVLDRTHSRIFELQQNKEER